ncbi:MAG: murein L,D-transpeptidase catalytic domain-containing protein [Flavobacteriales bacterium]
MKFFIGLILFSYMCTPSSLKDEKVSKINTKTQAKEALAFCKKNGMDTTFCILIDMSIHSGKKRMFIWDFKKDSLETAALCAHGSGSKPWSHDYSKENPEFSNVPDSHCSSLGKYKIGIRSYSSWGIKIHYKLHGLEKTNDKAFQRYVVLHSWEAIPDQEMYPAGAPEGWGCPVVSLNMMRFLDKKLQAAKKPVLLWIYH